MNYREAFVLINEAQHDIQEAEAFITPASTAAHAADNAANYAAIAQAKLLAVIAAALTEMKETVILQV
jgi:hypothetical protein